MQSKSVINYCNKLIPAPMVRGSLLPLRLLALRHGADLVYTDEIIDLSMLLTNRKVNDILETVDYVNEQNGYVLFRTSPSEKEKLVFQIGTADADRAVKVAKRVQNDVSAIDINMGCPKKYSTSLGIGAALLSNVDNAKKIVQGLVENVQLPITCKIRISDDLDQTIAMVKDFETLGVSAIAVHGRTRFQTRKEPVNCDAIRRISESVKIPIIANGGSEHIKNFDDAMKFKENCGATSVMLARAALWNPSIFRKEGEIPVTDLVTEYLKLCVDFDHSHLNAKYAISLMPQPFGGVSKSSIKHSFTAASSLEQLCDIWKLGDYCREKQSEYKAKGLHSLCINPLGGHRTPADLLVTREQMFSEKNVITERMDFRRKYGLVMARLPKVVLHGYCGKNKIPSAVYETTRHDRQYHCIVTFQEKQYASTYYLQGLKRCEQAAALVCGLHLGLYEEDFLLSIGCFRDERVDIFSIPARTQPNPFSIFETRPKTTRQIGASPNPAQPEF